MRRQFTPPTQGSGTTQVGSALFVFHVYKAAAAARERERGTVSAVLRRPLAAETSVDTQKTICGEESDWSVAVWEYKVSEPRGTDMSIFLAPEWCSRRNLCLRWLENICQCQSR